MQVVAACDLNPVSRGMLASPCTYARLKILAAKAGYILIMDCLRHFPKLQAILMFIAVWLIVLWNFQTVSVLLPLRQPPAPHGSSACHHKVRDSSCKAAALAAPTSSTSSPRLAR